MTVVGSRRPFVEDLLPFTKVNLAARKRPSFAGQGLAFGTTIEIAHNRETLDPLTAAATAPPWRLFFCWPPAAAGPRALTARAAAAAAAARRPSATSSSSRAAPRSQQELARPRRRLSGVRGSAAGFRRDPSAGCSAKARSSARARRSTRSTPASMRRRRRRPRPTSRAPGPARSPHGRAPRATRRWPRWRRSPSRIIPTRVAQARQADAAVAQNNAALRQRADQHALHARPCADHRPHRPVQRHRRRAGHRQPDRFAGDHHPARSRSIVDIQQSASDLLEAAPGAGPGRRGRRPPRRSG